MVIGADEAAIAPVWTPSAERVRGTNMAAYIRYLVGCGQTTIDGYDALYDFSVREPEAFWSSLWDFLDVIGEKGSEILLGRDALPGAKWFPQSRLNFAENLLRRRDDTVAVISRTEDGARRTLTWRELYDAVSRCRQALAASGVGPGDRVAACLPSVPEAVIAVLAAASLGAIWSACAPDYGEQSLSDRIGQIEPKVLIVADGYDYAGKRFDLLQKTEALAQALPSLECLVVVPFAGPAAAPPRAKRAVSWDDFLAGHAPGAIEFERFPFDHPLYILYSSGTTGKPKAIIHCAGGCLLQGLKDMVLHFDVQPNERTFFHTNSGWMVWNMMLSVFASGGSIVLYEGSPTHQKLDALFDIVAEERVNTVRMVPALVDAYVKGGLHPARSHNLESLKSIALGSAPLLPHHCDFIYRKVKADVHLLSPAGGTDVFGTLATGNPIGPVYSGEIQCRSLGMKVEIFDETDAPVIGRAGELVCTRPFPSVPLGFWDDPTREKFMATYFAQYPGVWRHGDWAEITPRGGVVMLGRADATLNVNGVRIGTAEIYRGIEAIHEIGEAVAVAQRHADGERILLFVILTPGYRLDGGLIARIGSEIRRSATARHVPARILQVADIPRSLNGKPSEIAVREVIHGREIPSQVGLSNPEALALFRDLRELAE